MILHGGQILRNIQEKKGTRRMVCLKPVSVIMDS